MWVTPQTKRVIVLAKILALNKSLALLSLAASMGTTIKQSYRSGIGCHNNFDKAKNAFLRVRGRFWNMMLMMFYLNVFYLPTLKDAVGYYKFCDEVMFGLNTNYVLQCLHPIAYKA